ncbi:MAG: right-handed parallel beta-helix repeat-containing protein, partial [bacterium]|nr:right-handed parallel beta-helix repeat-containing protein [bacterium]
MYNEQVDVINKTNVQFIGFGNNILIKDTTYSLTNYGFRIKDCQYIKIANFQLSYHKTAMIFLTNSQHCMISNNKANENNLYYEYGSGIKLMYSHNNKIVSNIIWSMEAPPLTQTSQCFGINLFLSRSNFIIKNEVHSSGSGKLPDGSGVDIWCHGIYLENSDNNLIRYNYLHDMDHYGIHVKVTGTFANIGNKILDNLIYGMDKGIYTENYPAVDDGLKGQVIGRNKIWNVARPIYWYSKSPGTAGSGGYIYKNSLSMVYSNNSYPEALYLAYDVSSDSSKVNLQYNSIQNFYFGIRFDYNGYSISNNAIGGTYSYNISRNIGSGAQGLNYSSTQTGKVRDITGGTGNVNREPQFTGLYNTRLAWNSPCIKAASPGPDGVRGSIGAHTSWLRARDETAGNTTIYTMVFVPSPYDGAIPGNGRIQIEFPIDFSFSTPSAVSYNFDGTLFTSAVGSLITFTRSGGTTIPAGKPIRIIFNNVDNPNYNYNEHYCEITTISNNNVIIEQEDSNNFRTVNASHALTVTTNITINETNMGAQNMRIMSINIRDTHLDYLDSIKIGNAGTMIQGTDISNIKIFIDRDANYRYTPPDPNDPLNTGDIYITNLIWNGTYWSNGNLSYQSNLISYPGANLIITVDYAISVRTNQYIKPYIPVNGIQCSGGLTTPLSALTNQGEIRHISLFISDYLLTQHNAAYSAIGDLNNDGWLDYVVSGCLQGGMGAIKQLDRYLNDGTGILGSPLNNYNIDRGPIVLGDLDHDGDLDLMATGESASSVPLKVFLNTGSGLFGAGITIGPNFSDGYLALGDLDKDGDLDLVAAGTYHLETFYNNGDATFSTPKSFGIPYSSHCALALADFNNDNYLDVIVCGEFRLELFLNKADNPGEFGPAIPFPLTPMSPPNVRGSSVSAGDLNNDGWQDIIVTGGKTSPALSVYINNKNNTFTEKIFGKNWDVAGSSYYEVGGISLGDIDNDGDLDICVSGTGVLDIFFNDGNGNLSGPYNLASIGYNGYRNTCVLGDIDNDGDLDLITSSDFGSMTVWENIFPIKNNAPYNPVNLIQDVIDYKWRFRWQPNPVPDDHTSDTMLRYKISIGTNQTGVYDYISDILDYPRGQANIGNIADAGSCTYLSQIPSNKTVYWKVKAIDTSFKISTNSIEISIPVVGQGPYYVATNGDDSNNGSYTNPFRTIQRAVDVMSVGPTNVAFPLCYIGPGTYNESVLISSNLNPDYILLTAWSNNKPPILDGTSTSNFAFYISNVNNIRIVNMIIKNYADNGIRIAGTVTNVRIYRGLFYNNPVHISINGESINCELINNTIFGSTTGDGIVWNDNSSGVLYNNIILSNNLYGVRKNSTGSVVLNYNDFHGNSSGPTNGNLTWENRNLLGDPMLNTITSFTISSRYSYALDSASNIFGVSDIYRGKGPDMGWKESSMSNINYGPYYVDITNGFDQYPGTLDRPFKTIQKAVERMSGGIEVTSATCYVMPGEYYDTVYIAQNNNPGLMVFKAYDTNSHPLLNGKNNYNNGIEIYTADKVMIDHFDIKTYRQDGVYINYYAISNIIMNCNIYSNNNGIHQLGESDNAYTTIMENRIFNNSQFGIYIQQADIINIYRNCIYHNHHGIQLWNNISGCYIFNNTLYQNNEYGIYIGENLPVSGYIYNNIFLSNGNYGVYLRVGIATVAYNIFKGHNILPFDDWVFGGITAGSYNYLDTDPLIDTTGTLEIMSKYSPSVDSASNIPGVSDTWYGKGPDRGWKESDFISTNYVHIISPVNTWTNTINNALGIAQNNVSIECHIPPWKYNEHIFITGKTDISIRARDWIDNHNKTGTILNGAYFSEVFYITNCKNITIEGFRITNALSYGISMIDSISNKILNNDIVNHSAYGIWCRNTNVNNNLIYGNNIYDSGPNVQNYGIHINGGRQNTIRSNSIRNNTAHGIHVQGIARSNIIIKNEIFSNSTYGIWINSASGNYNTVASNIIHDNASIGIYLLGSYNYIYANTLNDYPGGIMQDYGIDINSGGNNIIQENIIYNQDYGGILFEGTAQSNRIVNNIIFSNRRINTSYAGIRFAGDGVDYNTIISNRLYDNYTGIVQNNADHNKIFRNLFYNHTMDSASITVYLYSSSFSNEIHQNTFYNNNCGIYLGDPSSAVITNNIFLHHRSIGGGYSGYVLYSSGGAAGAGPFDYNVFWDNSYNTNATTVLVAGASNYYGPPQIDTTGTFEIISPNSSALDKAKQITGLNIPFLGSGPDIGWKESTLDSANRTNLVHVLPINVWTNSITNALKIADDNYIIECHTFSNFTVFPESIKINGFTNLILRSFAWTNNQDDTNTIIDASFKSYAIKITNCKNIKIQGFTIKNATNALYLIQSVSNKIVNNNIIDNFRSGVVLAFSNTAYNTIASNNINNDFTTVQNYGIRMTNSSYNLVYTNNIFNNNITGIHLGGKCRSNVIKLNNIYNQNTWDQNQGIQINNGVYNIIYNNRIFHHQDYGIYLTGTASTNQMIKNTFFSNNAGPGIYFTGSGLRYNIVMSNEIYNNLNNGLVTGGSFNIVKRNLIHHNDGYGLYVYQAQNNDVVNNTIYSNQDDGIRGYQSTFAVYNNIILSNKGYGVNWASSGIISLYNNISYGNTLGPWLNSIYISNLTGNITNQDPMIDTVSSYTIKSPQSFAVDSAYNLYGESYNGYGLDMGWKESYFISSNYVHILPPLDTWTNTIQNAVNKATNNCVINCYIKPTRYFESVLISGKTNLILQAFSWTNNRNNTSTIIDGGTYARAIFITNSKKIKVQGFTITKANYGIEIINSFSNIILNNLLYNNLTSGISLFAGADQNYIATNQGFNLITADQDNGLELTDGNHNQIVMNKFYDNNNRGIYFHGTGKSNIVRNNQCVNSNTTYQNIGILITDNDNNTIILNKLFNNQDQGVRLNGTAQYNDIIRNSIYSNDSGGIELNGGTVNYNNIRTNQIFNNGSHGLYFYNAPNNNFMRNRIYNNNGYGLYGSGNGLSYSLYAYNNVFFKNTSGGIMTVNAQPWNTSAYCYNNIFLSNNNYGVKGNNTGAPVGRIYLYYNLFCGNSLAPWYDEGTITIGQANITNADPLIDTITSFTVISSASP